MDDLMNDCQNGLELLDDLKEKKKEMEDDVKEADEGKQGLEGMAKGQKDGILGLAEGGIEGIRGSTDGGIEEITGATKGEDTATTSESEERASDDSYSIGSFFSDLESFGSNAEELLEESKKFFTKLGAVVAIIGTCINTGSSFAEAIERGDIRASVATGFLLLAIQIPTTLAMLIVFLKEWVKATIKGFLKAKEEIEELASDLDSFVDDSESDENGGEVKSKTTRNRTVESEGLKTDLENTKKKNNYNSVDEFTRRTSNGHAVMDKNGTGVKNHKPKKVPPVKSVSKKGKSDAQLENTIRCMEEGKLTSTKSESSCKPQMSQTRQTGNTTVSHKNKTSVERAPRSASSRKDRDKKVSKSPGRSSQTVRDKTRRSSKKPPIGTKGNATPHRSSSCSEKGQQHKPNSLNGFKVASSKNIGDSRTTKPLKPKQKKTKIEEELH